MSHFESIHLDQLTTIHGGQTADPQPAPCPTAVYNCTGAGSCSTVGGNQVVNTGSGKVGLADVPTTNSTTNIKHGISIGGFTIPLPFGG